MSNTVNRAKVVVLHKSQVLMIWCDECNKHHKMSYDYLLGLVPAEPHSVGGFLMVSHKKEFTWTCDNCGYELPPLSDLLKVCPGCGYLGSFVMVKNPKETVT